MTPDQFSALAELIKLRASASREAARLVLVEGITAADAARRMAITPAAVSNALRSCRRGLDLACAAIPQ